MVDPSNARSFPSPTHHTSTRPLCSQQRQPQRQHQQVSERPFFAPTCIVKISYLPSSSSSSSSSPDSPRFTAAIYLCCPQKRDRGGKTSRLGRTGEREIRSRQSGRKYVQQQQQSTCAAATTFSSDIFGLSCRLDGPCLNAWPCVALGCNGGCPLL